ncbi:hypothetical protein BD626DRAFT_65637 [Schizophyllum amplum]|uniref:F-box domain-containing protein n=1 Tax=Schizophyllum amplum TaxID=97359 RepID=A0A550CB18_9AGAR|nr:hypothetical protein BD626DRAFT_65637 [Auriculariopsis ampla]
MDHHQDAPMASPAKRKTRMRTRINQTAPLLPQELCDLIIKYATGNPRVVRACSLVCRAWSQSARVHLFRRLPVAPPGWKSALRFFEQPARTCGFLPLVQTLAISGDIQRIALVNSVTWLKTLAERVDELTGVTTIELEALSQELETETWGYLWSYPPFSAQITSLTMHRDVIFPNLCALTAFVAQLSNLRILATDCLSVHDPTGCECLAPPPHLHRLKVTSFAGWETWLQAADTHTLRSLELFGILERDSYQSLHRYISTPGVQLDYLELPLNPQGVTDLLAMGPLPAHSVVRTVCLKDLVVCMNANMLTVYAPSAFWHVELVSTVLRMFGPSLRRAALVLAWELPPYTYTANELALSTTAAAASWRAIDSLVAHGDTTKHPPLQRFTVVLATRMEPRTFRTSRTKEIIQGYMTECQARDILKFRDYLKEDMWIRGVIQE